MNMNLLKPDKKYRNGYKNPKHLARVGNLPCSLCYFLGQKQKTRTTVHHYHGGGMGKKGKRFKSNEFMRSPSPKRRVCFSSHRASSL